MKSGIANDIDWTTTIIAAFSFLFHFGAVGSIYSDWMDPIVDDEVDVAALLESVKQLPPPPAVEQPKENAETLMKDRVVRLPEKRFLDEFFSPLSVTRAKVRICKNLHSSNILRIQFDRRFALAHCQAQ